jgi:hypothetical protein
MREIYTSFNYGQVKNTLKDVILTDDLVKKSYVDIKRVVAKKLSHKTKEYSKDKTIRELDDAELGHFRHAINDLHREGYIDFIPGIDDLHSGNREILIYPCLERSYRYQIKYEKMKSRVSKRKKFAIPDWVQSFVDWITERIFSVIVDKISPNK